MEIKNSTAVISGGASGLGAATAKLLRTAGAKVAIFDIDLNAANTVAKEIGALAFACDITDPVSTEIALKLAAEQQGPARICINCAGIATARRMSNKEGVMPLEAFQHVINVNLIGTFNLMRLAAYAMQALTPDANTQERGVIINTASIAAYEGQIGQTAYSASKGGIVSMTLPAARELAQWGIRVVTIAPGLVDTPLFQQIPESARAALIEHIPFPHRLAKPEEYARLAQHIIENAMINAEVIRLDGGLRMQAKA